jgi:hypothetical protein
MGYTTRRIVGALRKADNNFEMALDFLNDEKWGYIHIYRFFLDIYIYIHIYVYVGKAETILIRPSTFSMMKSGDIFT